MVEVETHAATDTGFKEREEGGFGFGEVVTPPPSPNPKLV